MRCKVCYGDGRIRKPVFTEALSEVWCSTDVTPSVMNVTIEPCEECCGSGYAPAIRVVARRPITVGSLGLEVVRLLKGGKREPLEIEVGTAILYHASSDSLFGVTLSGKRLKKPWLARSVLDHMARAYYFQANHPDRIPEDWRIVLQEIEPCGTCLGD